MIAGSRLLSVFTLAAVLLGTAPVFAQSPWVEVAQNRQAGMAKQERLALMPDRFRLLQLDESALRAQLVSAPREGQRLLAGQRATSISLPLPDGSMLALTVEDSPVMEPALAAKHPEIRSFVAHAPGVRGRLDISPRGFHGMLFTPSGTVYIDPRAGSGERYYVSYYQQDYAPAEKPRAANVCRTHELSPHTSGRHPSTHAFPAAFRSGDQLRTYRIAIAATGEYTTFHGGAVNALAAINTTLNRVNTIYERDVAVRMTLVGNNNTIVYTNAGTDPYTNNNGSAMLSENQATIDGVIGSANYDIGHVFSTGGGGIAGLGVVCNAGFKAWGVTGLTSPVGDPFDIDFVAHEIGHQFNAEHTFNGTTGSCGVNRSAAFAYEPGSGATIMAYAGICGAENLQSNSDAMFHAASIDAIVGFTTTGGGSACAAVSSTGKALPTVNAGTPYTIPANTPFELTGSSNNPNGGTLSYSWEQMNLGTASSSPATMVDDGSRPIFRTFPPSASPTRTFPRLSDLLNNTTVLGESLPTTTRALNFRLTVRDAALNVGAVDSADVQLQVVNTAGPFRVTAPDSAVALGGATTVTWNTANTNGGPVNCPNVDILLSTDGGNTFPTTLAAATPNDGSESVTFPASSSTTARIKVKCANNIFFDISNSNFSFAGINVAPVANNDAFTVVTGRNSSLNVLANDTDLNPGDTKTINTVSATSNGGTVTINGAGPNNTLSYTSANGFIGTETFTYTMRDTAGLVSGSATVTVTVTQVPSKRSSGGLDWPLLVLLALAGLAWRRRGWVGTHG